MKTWVLSILETPVIQHATTELLSKVDCYKHITKPSKVLKELAGVLAKPLSITYRQSWLTREVLTDWKSASVTPI